MGMTDKERAAQYRDLIIEAEDKRVAVFEIKRSLDNLVTVQDNKPLTKERKEQILRLVVNDHDEDGMLKKSQDYRDFLEAVSSIQSMINAEKK